MAAGRLSPDCPTRHGAPPPPRRRGWGGGERDGPPAWPGKPPNTTVAINSIAWYHDSECEETSLMYGGITMPTRDPYMLLMDQDISAVQGGVAYLSDIERRLAPYFERAEPRQRAMAYLRGLLSPVERKNTWQLAELIGDATPYGFQHLLRRALWDPDAVRDELRTYVIQHLGDPHGALVIEETGFLKKGQRSAGVSRQYSPTAGRRENCQIGVFLGYVSRRGQALLDRALYVSETWTDDPRRCRQAGIPQDHRLATRPQLGQQMLQRARAASMPARWVTNDSGYGAEWR